MYKVFIDDKIFYVLINASKSVLNTNIKLYQAKMFDQVFDLLKANTQPIAFTFFSKKEAQKAISKKFTWVTAAGGLVKNDQDELLLIFRNGQWDLPKGKLEKNEKNKHTAIREVEEECGISKPKIINGLKKANVNTFLEYAFLNKKDLKNNSITENTTLSKGDYEIIEYSYDKIVIKTIIDKSHSGFLVLLNSYNPFWKVNINNDNNYFNEDSIIPTYHCFWGVLVPSGESLITFTYEPPKNFLFSLF